MGAGLALSCVADGRGRRSCDRQRHESHGLKNSMTNQKINKDDMLPKIGYVKAGVVEIMQKQQQGYAYVRP